MLSVDHRRPFAPKIADRALYVDGHGRTTWHKWRRRDVLAAQSPPPTGRCAGHPSCRQLVDRRCARSRRVPAARCLGLARAAGRVRRSHADRLPAGLGRGRRRAHARRWWLAAAAVAIVATQLVFVAPELLAAAPVPSWARSAAAVRVFDANIDKALDFEAGYARAIEEDRPDLVTLEEFTPSALANMESSGVLSNYPYRCVAPAYGADGFLVASRLRLTGCRVQTVHWDGFFDALHGRGHPMVARWAGRLTRRAHPGTVPRVLAGVVECASRCRSVSASEWRQPDAHGRGLQRHLGKPRFRCPSPRRPH